MTKAVLYIRSTPSNPPAKQRQMVQPDLDGKGINIIAEEVERAKTKTFPAFRRALEAADGRLIIISNLGQLVKSPPFLTMLQEAGNFQVLGHPECQPDTLEALLKAAKKLAAETREKIKDSLAVLKKKGVPLGSHRPGATAGAEALRRHAGKGPKIASRL